MGKKANELEELKKKYQLLLFFNGQIAQICMMHTGLVSGIDYNDIAERLRVDLFLKFNIHAFTAYFIKYFYGKYKVTPENQKEFLVGWNKNMEKVINPLYQEEIKKLKALIEKGKNIQSYVS